MKNLVAVLGRCGMMALSAEHNTPNTMTTDTLDELMDIYDAASDYCAEEGICWEDRDA